jgi:heme-degrading monooxygenase HmoA
MIAILFELWPAEGCADAYFGLAAALKEELERIDGFVSVERFQSLSDPRKLLSLSFFRDEEAVRAWRNLPGHRAAQARGRAEILADYRLRVAHVRRDYGKTVRDEAPRDSREAHERRLANPC